MLFKARSSKRALSTSAMWNINEASGHMVSRLITLAGTSDLEPSSFREAVLRNCVPFDSVTFRCVKFSSVVSECHCHDPGLSPSLARFKGRFVSFACWFWISSSFERMREFQVDFELQAHSNRIVVLTEYLWIEYHIVASSVLLLFHS